MSRFVRQRSAGAFALLGIAATTLACDASPAKPAKTDEAAVPVLPGAAIDLRARGAAAAGSTPVAKGAKAANAADLSSVVRRARHAFRPSPTSATSYAARGEGYQVAVAANGAVTLTAQGPGRRASTPFVFAAAEPATGAPHRETDGALTTTRGEMTERLENRADGLEASWSFARRPSARDATDRDLHLSISTSGLSYVATDATGVHFRAAGEAAGIRFGHATWVDALGLRTKVTGRVDGAAHALVFDVPADVLDRSAYPATLDPLVGPENGGDTPVTGPSYRTQNDASVCASASSYYVTWIDQRREPEDPYTSAAYDLYGARVDPATGRAVAADVDGVLLASDLLTDSYPACGSDGTNFLVAVGNDFDMLGVRVDGASGKPLAQDSPSGIVLGAATGYFAPPTIGYANGNYVVAWTDPDGLRSARLPSTGAPLAVDETILSGVVANPYLACSPTGCLVSFLDLSTYESFLIHEDPATGPLAADVAAPISFPYDNPFFAGMVWTGTGYFIGWQTIAQVSNLGIELSGVLDGDLWSAETNASIGSPFQIPLSGIPTNATMAYDGTQVVLGLNLGSPGVARDLYIGLGTQTTYGVSAPLVSGLVANTKLGVAAIGGSSLLAGVSPTGDQSIVTARVADATGTVAPADTGGVALSLDANAEVFPAIAANANGALAVWTDDRIGADLTYSARLDKSGNVVSDDLAGVQLTTISGQSSAPAVATDGTDFVVVWYQANAGGSVISGGRVSAKTGKLTQVMPPITDPRTSAVGAPTIAYGAGKYAVAFAAGTEIQANLIDATTLAPTGAPQLVFATPARPAFPTPAANGGKLAFSGSNFLLAWSQSSASSGFEIDAARFTPDGTMRPGDGTGVVLTALADGASGVGVAGNTSRDSYILTWFDGRDPLAGQQVYSRVVAADADFGLAQDNLVGGTGIVFGTDVVDPPATAVTDAADGLSFQVAWATTDALYGALVGYDGITRDASPLLLADDPGYYAHPALATVSPGSMILAYSRDILAPPYGDYRVRARVLGTGPTAGTCTTADDCASRNCADGFCCDTPCNGSCETCAATPGKCTPVEGKADPDTCNGNQICDATGVCGLVPGNACTTDSACASGFCSDNVCCTTACDGACDVCNASAATAGTCTVVAAGSEGAPSCSPNVCNGTSAACPTGCTADTDCVRPYTCDVHHVCALLTTGECEDDVTLESPNGNLTKCTPYRCEATACATSCTSIADCADGYVCNARGTCVAATADDLGSGCAVPAGGANQPGEAFGAAALGIVAAALGRRRRGQKRQSRRA